ncbi:hypothetical protein EOM86_05055 [Candidatus Nomurabacteria bacterium]|nr:hypothetical protein [Candidatus Nomurabacteria bacterium]
MRKRKLPVILLVVTLVVGALSVQISALSGYASRNMNNSYSYTKFTCTFWVQNNFWDTWWGADGTSRTAWLGSSPVNADSIVHRDILSCTGIGSMGIGISPSGPNASVSLSGHTATYSYSLDNDWRINTYYGYKHTGLLAFWNASMRTSATVRFGSNFYTWGN